MDLAHDLSPLTRLVRRKLFLHRRLVIGATVLASVLVVARALHPSPASEERSLASSVSESHPGQTTMPVRFPDAQMADLLSPGDAITLLVVGGDPADPAAAPTARSLGPATVVDLAAEPAGGGDGRLVIVAVSPDAAESVAAAGSTGYLSYTFSAFEHDSIPSDHVSE